MLGGNSRQDKSQVLEPGCLICILDFLYHGLHLYPSLDLSPRDLASPPVKPK